MLYSQLSLPDSFEACYLEYNRVFPLAKTETHVRVAAAGDVDPDVIAQLEREFALTVELVPVSEAELADSIRQAYAAAESLVEVMNDLSAGEVSTFEEQTLADARDLASESRSLASNISN